MEEKLINIQTISEKLFSLSRLAIEQYTQEVDDILTLKISDENHIQKTLDGLLDFCYDDKILYLYRKLCKYYYDINSQATIDYIGYYKERYDCDSTKFGDSESFKNSIIENKDCYE